jgi:hypothetical protein
MANQTENQDSFDQMVSEIRARIATKLEHAYVVDLIEVLRPHPRGLARRTVLRAVEENRRRVGLRKAARARFPNKTQATSQSGEFRKISPHRSVYNGVVRRNVGRRCGLHFSPFARSSPTRPRSRSTSLMRPSARFGTESVLRLIHIATIAAD